MVIPRCYCPENALVCVANHKQPHLCQTPIRSHCNRTGCIQRTTLYSFVIRTGVKAYCESFDHTLLLDKLATHIKDKFILNLPQHTHRVIEYGGTFTDIKYGISRSCPLSPIISSFYLAQLDRSFSRNSVYYGRYIDDILKVTRTRWSLRRIVNKK